MSTPEVIEAAPAVDDTPAPEATTEPVVEPVEPVQMIDEGGRRSPMAIKKETDDKIEALLEAAKTDEVLASDEEHKGISFDETLAALPDDAKKLLANMRRDYTQKTQAIADERRQIEAQRAALFESEAFKALQEMSNKEMGEFDPYNPDSVVEHIKRQVAEQFTEVLKPMRDQQFKAQSKAKLQAFMSEHPDLRTDDALRGNVKELMLGDEHIRLDQAYWIAKGKSLSSSTQAQAEELARFRTAAREAGLKVSGGTRTGGNIKPPDGLDAVGIYQWYERQKSAR